MKKVLKEIPMIGKALSWLTDPSAIGRKRTVAAVAGILAGMMRGADDALRQACKAADVAGAACSFEPLALAGLLEGFAAWLNTYVVPGADAVTILVGLWGLWAARNKKALVVATLLLIAMIPGGAIAQEANPTPTPNVVTLSTGFMRFVTPGIKDAKDLEAHLAATIHTPAKTITEAFARWTRTQGAADGVAGLLDPRTFASVYAELRVSRAITSHFDAGCSAGVSWNRDGEFDPRDPRLWAFGCGGRFTIAEGSLSGEGGHNGSVGGLAVWGKLVVRQTATVRYVATYAIPFQHPTKFRVNPGSYTGGVQIDVFTRSLPF